MHVNVRFNYTNLTLSTCDLSGQMLIPGLRESAVSIKHKMLVKKLLVSITYLRVSLVLQVEQEKQLTHQALLRADTTVEEKENKYPKNCWYLQATFCLNY